LNAPFFAGQRKVDVVDVPALALEDFIATHQPPRIDVTIEHSDVAEHDVWKMPLVIHKLGERLSASQHQTEFAVRVHEVRKRSKAISEQRANPPP